MNILSKIAFTLFLSVLFFSCSEDINKEEIYTYKSEKVNFTKMINNKLGINSKSSESSEDYIHSEFQTSFYIPENLSNSETEIYINENQNLISGTLKLLVNNNDYITIEISNGNQSKITTSNKNLFKGDPEYPCTYKGIQDCVKQRVYEEWSKLKALVCAVFTGGLGCIMDEVVDCIGHSCFENKTINYEKLY